jgi:hypothetical protein
LVVLGLAFLLLGAFRAYGFLSWKLEELEATTPSRAAGWKQSIEVLERSPSVEKRPSGRERAAG